jgi:predicted ATPase
MPAASARTHPSPAAPAATSVDPTIAATAAAAWQLHLLGRFELSDGLQRHTRLVSRQAMALLARLSLQPAGSHPRETLAALLWPDAPGEAARHRLRKALSTLKQVLEPADGRHGPVLDADRHSLRLVPGRLRCDVLDFESAFKTGDHERARALYTGDLLPGFLDEWISDERLRLEGLFDRLRPAQVPAAPLVLPASPLVPAASPRAPAPQPAGPQRTQLPAYLTRLIAADPQAVRLAAAVAEHRLVTLMGPGGAGKTRLAVAVGQALADQAAFEFVVFVPLATCSTRQQLLDQLLLALRVGEGKGGSLATLVQALQGQHALLVLDNFEQLVDDGAEAVGELAAALPLLHLLVTSRRALALAGERELVVDTLPLPAPGAALDAVAASPAVRLFVDRASAARAGFALDADNAAAVAETVRLLEGMPLAIELAAARVRSMEPAEIAATLQLSRAGQASALDLLARAPQRGRQDTRHQSMQDTIAWSWQLLGDGLRTLLPALTVFHGGFSSAAAAAVCGDGRVPAMAAQLDELLSHSLLRPQSQNGSARFALYEPIREFALQQLPVETAAALRQRHRAWAIAWGQAMPVTPSMPALQLELPNLVAAMSSAVADGTAEDAVRVALSLQRTLEEVRLPGAGLAALEAAVPTCTDPLLHSAGLTLLGRLLFIAGRGTESLALVAQGLALAPADQPALRSRALLMAVHAARSSGKGVNCAPELLTMLEEAQALSTALGDQAALAAIHACRADIVRLHDPAQAEALQRSALATHEALGDRLGAIRCRYSLAILAHRNRRYLQMLEAIEPVVNEARHLQAWVRLAASLNVRAEAYQQLRRWQAAADDLRTGLQVAFEALATIEAAYLMSNLPYVLLRIGQTLPALTLAGFFITHWQPHFGALKGISTERARRLGLRLLGPDACNAALAAGAQLSAAQAVALALDPPR